LTPEDKTLGILKRHRVDFVAALPCDRNKNLYEAALARFKPVELSREEEGVGICAGALMAGARPVMLIQSSGFGNMVNAIASLDRHYRFALPIVMSWRGRDSETIAAQEWMGEYVPKILAAMDIPYHEIYDLADIDQLDATLDGVFDNDEIRGYLFEPSVWKGSDFAPEKRPAPVRTRLGPYETPMPPEPGVTRYGLLQRISGALKGKAVACNLGFPCKELFGACHQPSNFYMLGSMGMVTPIALGMALCSDKPVVSIDGDGSLLMNPSTLATIARTGPKNLAVLCVDNGAYGSTGNQATATASHTDLAKVAHGFGMENIVRSGDPEVIAEALEKFNGSGPVFIHAMCRAGNADAPNLTITPEQIRRSVEGFLRG